jgi:hypothetical protein
MSIIRRMPNPEHMARCVAAVRARWEAEASFQAAHPAVTVNVVPIRRRVGAE